MGAVKSIALMRRGCNGNGTSLVVSPPDGKPSTEGTSMGMKVMKSSWRLKGSNLDCVFLGNKNAMLWPLSASLLERWINVVICPTANHGYMTILRVLSDILGSLCDCRLRMGLIYIGWSWCPSHISISLVLYNSSLEHQKAFDRWPAHPSIQLFPFTFMINWSIRRFLKTGLEKGCWKLGSKQIKHASLTRLFPFAFVIDYSIKDLLKFRWQMYHTAPRVKYFL